MPQAETLEGYGFHSWDLSPREAIQTQNDLRSRVRTIPLTDAKIRRVAGVDVGLPRGTEVARAAIAVLDYATLEWIDQAIAEMPVRFPYVPGLLSFREMPVILAALANLQTSPDVFIVDGQGYAHPRRFGLACHLGIWLDKPAIGCGKSRLIGETEALAKPRGSLAVLRDQGEIIGLALRTRANVRPVYVSVGHRVDLDSAARIVLQCSRGLRLPEPIRQAHHLASAKNAG